MIASFLTEVSIGFECATTWKFDENWLCPLLGTDVSMVCPIRAKECFADLSGLAETQPKIFFLRFGTTEV
jgi:hypothetical protein